MRCGKTDFTAIFFKWWDLRQNPPRLHCIWCYAFPELLHLAFNTIWKTEPEKHCLKAAYLRWQWFPAGDVCGCHSGRRLGAAGWAARLLSTAAGILLPVLHHATRGAAEMGSVPHHPVLSPWEQSREQPSWEQDWQRTTSLRTRWRTTYLRRGPRTNLPVNMTKSNLPHNRA